MGSKSNDWYPYKEKKRELQDTEAKGRRPRVDRGRDWSCAAQTKECQETPEVKRGKEGFSSRALGGLTS